MKHKIDSIIRHILLLMAIVCLPASAYAVQGTAKQINDIKRSGTCFHAESTAPTQKEATEAATQMLAYHINEYIKDNSLSCPRVSENSIAGIKYIEMKRGSNIRVFAYVDKDNILKGEAPAPRPEPTETQTPPAPAPPAPAPAPAQPARPEPAAPTEQPIEQTIDTSTDEDLTVTTAEVDAVANAAIVNNYVKALESLIAAGDLQSVLKRLQRLEAEYVVKRYGPYAKCKNKTWAFWMIYDNNGKDLIGFLSPGKEGERLNVVTNNENDSLSNYLGQGKIAVWFEFK